MSTQPRRLRTKTAELIPQIATLRYEADLLQADTANLDRQVHAFDLDLRTDERQTQGIQTFLATLSERWGLGWTAIARMVGVSIPALRKWRLGEPASPTNRRALARLVAMLEMLSGQFMVEDPASWLEIPLAGSTITLSDIYAGRREDLVIEYAGRRIATAEQLLAQFSPQWHESTDAQSEIFVAGDGQLAVRQRTG